MTLSTWEVKACKGEERDCPYCLVSLSDIKTKIDDVLRTSGWETFLKARVSGPILPHRRLRVALSACPNACTKPQIRDIGIIARVVPDRVSVQCIACGECQEVCDEDAILCSEDAAALQKENCAGCGLCVRTCPTDAIESAGVRFRFLAGGTMGRHPAWAREVVPDLTADLVPIAVEGFVEMVMSEMRKGEDIPEMVARVQPARSSLAGC